MRLWPLHLMRVRPWRFAPLFTRYLLGSVSPWPLSQYWGHDRWNWLWRFDRCSMGRAGAADRAVPPAPQDGARRPPTHHRGDHLAARQRREMAQHSAASGSVVDGGTDLQPLEPPWCVGASAGTGATARGG